MFVILNLNPEVGYVKITPSEDSWHIDYLCVYPRYRGKGFSRQLLDKTCKQADENKRKLLLSIANLNIQNGLDLKNLCQLYSSFGFEFISDASMQRLPQPPSIGLKS